MDLPSEVRENLPKWKRMGYEPHYVELPRGGETLKVFFRTLTKREFDELSQSHQNPEAARLGVLYSDQFTEIVETALLWPSPLPGDLPAATDKLLAEAIIEASAWISTERLIMGLGEARQEAGSLEGFIHSRILAAFPSIQLKDIQKMTFSEMMKLAAMSELITGVPVDIQPWVDPEGYEKRMRREARRAKMAQSGMDFNSNNLRSRRDPETRQRLFEAAKLAQRNLEEGPVEDKSLEQLIEETNRGLSGI